MIDSAIPLPSFASRASAEEAVSALERHLMSLLVLSDLVASLGQPVAGREMRRALERSIVAVRVLREELLIVEIIETCLRSQDARPS